MDRLDHYTFWESTTGLSSFADGTLLRDAIESNPIRWLGQSLYDKFETSIEILVKLFDSDPKFALVKLQINHGKTESWIVLDAPVHARVELGFNRATTKLEVAGLVAAHDSQGLLDSLVLLEVRTGDAIFVPTGVPHAIDSGIFVLE